MSILAMLPDQIVELLDRCGLVGIERERKEKIEGQGIEPRSPADVEALKEQHSDQHFEDLISSM